MNVSKIFGGVACLSLLLGTGVLAEMVGGEPGTSKNPKDNVPQEIQRDTPSGGDFGQGGSGPGDRSNALSGMKKEQAVEVTEQGLEQNAEKTHEGGAARAAQELERQGDEKMSHSGGAAKAAKELEAEGEAKRSHSGGAARAAEELKEKGEQSHKDIAAQSSHKGMKKDMKKK